jgi:hypothetical protein
MILDLMLAFIPFITNKTTKKAVTLMLMAPMDSQAIRLTRAPALLEKIKWLKR